MLQHQKPHAAAALSAAREQKAFLVPNLDSTESWARGVNIFDNQRLFLNNLLLFRSEESQSLGFRVIFITVTYSGWQAGAGRPRGGAEARAAPWRTPWGWSPRRARWPRQSRSRQRRCQSPPGAETRKVMRKCPQAPLQQTIHLVNPLLVGTHSEDANGVQTMKLQIPGI